MQLDHDAEARSMTAVCKVEAIYSNSLTPTSILLWTP